MLGPLERYMTLTLNTALLSSSRVVADLGQMLISIFYALKHGLIGSSGGILTQDLKIVRCPLCHLSHRASVSLDHLYKCKFVFLTKRKIENCQIYSQAYISIV